MKNKNSKNTIPKKMIIDKGRFKNYKNARNYPKNSIIYIVNKNKFLVFIAGTHISNLNTKESKIYLAFFHDTFKIMKPNLVLIESPINISKEVLKSKLFTPKKWWTEKEYAITFANEFKADVSGMDASTDDQDNIFLIQKGKRTPKLFLFSEFLKFYYSMAGDNQNKHVKKSIIYHKARGILSFLLFDKNSNLYKIRYDILKIQEHMNKTKNLEDTIDEILQETIDKYVKKGMNVESIIDLKNIYLCIGETSMGHPDYKINRIIEKWLVIRNNAIVKSCIESLNKHKVILAVAGASHIKEIKERLNHELLNKYNSVESMSLKEFLKEPSSINKLKLKSKT